MSRIKSIVISDAETDHLRALLPQLPGSTFHAVLRSALRIGLERLRETDAAALALAHMSDRQADAVRRTQSVADHKTQKAVELIRQPSLYDTSSLLRRRRSAGTDRRCISNRRSGRLHPLTGECPSLTPGTRPRKNENDKSQKHEEPRTRGLFATGNK